MINEKQPVSRQPKYTQVPLNAEKWHVIKVCRQEINETKRDDINPLLDAAGVILTHIAALERPKVRAFPIADTDSEQPEPTSSFLYPALDEKG
jgi:hypothetical protein